MTVPEMVRTLAIEEGACFVGPVCVGGTRATIEEMINGSDEETATAGNFHRVESLPQGGESGLESLNGRAKVALVQ